MVKPLSGRVKITEAHDGIIDKLMLVTIGVGVSFMCVVGVAYLLSWTDGQAKEKADKERKAILTDSPNRSPRARLYVRNESKVFKIYSGYIINASATHAALYSKDKGMVILPMSSIARIEVEEQGEKEK